MSETGTTQTLLSRWSGVHQPSISQFLTGRTELSDEMLERLLGLHGLPARGHPSAGRAGADSVRAALLAAAPAAVDPPDAAVLQRVATADRGQRLSQLRSQVTGQPHTRNLERWGRLVGSGDVSGLRRVLTGLDRDSIEMREVSPMGGLLSQEERQQVLAGPLMRRDQLEHAIRTACQIIGADAVIVVGSQAILGSVDEGLLPPEATMSLEVDILPIAPDEPSTVELADRIEGVAGEWSPFEELHGFSIDGVESVDSRPSSRVAGSPGQGAERQHGRHRWHPAVHRMVPGAGHDLCVAKLVALREKDANFVASLLAAGLVDPTVIAARLDRLDPEHALAAERAKSWPSSWA